MQANRPTDERLSVFRYNGNTYVRLLADKRAREITVGPTLLRRLAYFKKAGGASMDTAFQKQVATLLDLRLLLDKEGRLRTSELGDAVLASAGETS